MFPTRLLSLRATVLFAAIVAPTFFAVGESSSDALRYQATLLPLLTALGMAGVLAPMQTSSWRVGVAALVLSGTVFSARDLPSNPDTQEHRWLSTNLGQLPPRSLVVLPPARLEPGGVRVDFPAHLLPAGRSVVRADQPLARSYGGPRIAYLGTACIAAPLPALGGASQTRRRECEDLVANAEPIREWTLDATTLPRRGDGDWTFHQYAAGLPMGLYRLGE